ncbi:MAG: MGMT family protein [Betaproteobacteria bacterium]
MATPKARTDSGAIHARIYAAVKKIPRGKVATYGQIAALAGMPRHARQAGYALAATPEGMKIPWHRVINAQGRISLRLRHWDSGSDDLQKILLEAEGVEFDTSGKINLKKFQWQPVPDSTRERAGTVAQEKPSRRIS